jgi:hypothetical protein
MAAQKPDPFVVSWRPTSLDAVKWEQKSDELRFQTLDRVRSAAEKWAVSLGGVLALFGTVLVVKGRQDIALLVTEWQVAIGLLLLTALALAVAAALYAAYAAQGTPKDVVWPSGDKLRRYEHEQAKLAKRRLKCSRILTLGAVLVLAAAVGGTWFGTPKPTAVPKVLAVPQQGVAACGPVQRDGGGELFVGTGRARVVLGQLTELVVPVTTCP